MAAKVMMIGFDAVESTLVERWEAEGYLPTFSELGRSATLCPLASTVDYLPDTLWAELTLGRSAPAQGWYWQPEQIHVGEARLRKNRPDDFDVTAFWRHASDAGRRVAILDVPYAAPAPGLDGVLLRDWGTHSSGFGRGSDPAEYVSEIEERYGPYPFPHGWDEEAQHGWGCDAQDGSRQALEQFPQRLGEAIDLKTSVLLGELEREDWDLFVGVLHEGHCAGHQLWHYLDESSPWYDPDAPAGLKNGVRDVYEHLDRSLARLLEAAGEDTTVLVLFSRGMGSHVGGWHMIPEILVRLGYTSAGTVGGSMRSKLPAPVRRAIKAAVRGSMRQRLKEATGTPRHPLEQPRTRAMFVRNGANGGIRINVKGREPFGSVEPGAEYDEVCAELATEFEALRDAATGDPVVTGVLRSDEVFGERYHPNLPDLIVQFRKDAVITSVTSPRIGTISEPARHSRFARSGEHTPHTRLWVRGPGIAADSVLEGGHVLDVGATVLDLLGVSVPATLDGTPLALRKPVAA
jgi:predicted AlkP superfamily phosphohydrolase/phosphomutase